MVRGWVALFGSPPVLALIARIALITPPSLIAP